MSFQDAANLVTVQEGQSRILADPSLSVFDKARALEAIERAAVTTPQSQGLLSTGDLVRGAIGAGVGYGAATLFGSLLTSNPDTLTMAQRLGMGLGTLINTGLLMNKTSQLNPTDQARVDAFRLGFCKAALDLGLLREPELGEKLAGIVGNVPLIEAIKTPVDVLSGLSGTAATTSGALLGHMTGDTSDDVDLTNMALKQRELENRADMIENNRRSTLLKKVLDRRMGRR
jgi:hypothetical protein